MTYYLFPLNICHIYYRPVPDDKLHLVESPLIETFSGAWHHLVVVAPRSNLTGSRIEA